MNYPIPADTQQERLFDDTYADSCALVHHLGHYSVSSHCAVQPLGHITRKGYFRFDSAVLPFVPSGPLGTHFLQMDHPVPHIITFHKQAIGLQQAAHTLETPIIQAALRIATHEILDNDHRKLFTGQHKTPFYDIASLATDLVNGALRIPPDTLHHFYENCDGFIADSYYMNRRYVAVKRTIAS